MPYKILFASLLLSLSIQMHGLPAAAQTAPQTRVGAMSWATGHGLIARVTINDQPVATLRSGAGGFGPADRALLVKKRLSALLCAGLTPGQISAVPVRGQGWEIRGRGMPLLLVTPREAAAQRQPVRKLALAWAGNIKRRMAEPLLTLSERSLLVPYGTTKTVTVGGAARPAEIVLDAGDPHVATTILDPIRHRLIITGTGSGQTHLQVHAGGVTLPLQIIVQRYAAIVQPRVTVRVTGKPFVPADLVKTALYFGLKRSLAAEPGSQMRLLQAPTLVASLRPGEAVSRRLRLRVAGPGLLPVEAAPLVTIINQPLQPSQAEALFYSNNPEQVRENQTLFSAPLTLGQAVRLDYHHQNRSGSPLIFHTDVVNTGNQAAAVHILGGIAQPELDTVQVGRRAGADFLSSLDGGIGLIIDVPAHARIPLVIQRFAPDLTVSGIFQIQQVSGPDKALMLNVIADGDHQALESSPGHLALAVADSVQTKISPAFAPISPVLSEPSREKSPYIFGPPRVSLETSYVVGKNWSHLRLGHSESLHNAEGTQTLWGNYGVSYFVTAQISNPTPDFKTVGIFFSPEAGLAAGVFQVSGDPVLQFDPMAPPEEKQLTRIRLAPGEIRTVHIRTILLNGSAYPVSLVIHAL